MQEGERSPAKDVATSADARRAAVSAALADDVNEEYGNDEASSAAEPDQSQPSSEPDAAPPEPEVAETADPERPVEDQPVVKEQASPDAPAVWPKDRREWFARQSDDDKRIILDMEKQHNARFTKNTQENAEHRKRSEAVQQVFTDEHRQQMHHAGVDEIGAIRQLVSLHDFFTRDPVGYVKHMIQTIGATPDQLFGGQQQPPQQQATEQDQTDEWVDPMVLELRSQLEASNGKLQALEASLGQFQQHHSQREALTLQEEIQAFQSATDASGNPVRPFYEDVKPIMKHLIDTDPEVSRIPDWKAAEKLQAAYDKAVWLKPEIREKLIESQVSQNLSAQMSQASLDRAKSAATRKPSPGANGQAQVGRMNRMDAVAAALRETGQA